VTRVHLDTDLGGDPDDVCALAMLLGWPDVEITGITTTLDVAGRGARHVVLVFIIGVVGGDRGKGAARAPPTTAQSLATAH